MDSFTFFEISETELKSPGLETGKPASITSTPRLSKSLAISTFSSSVRRSWQTPPSQSS